MFSFIADNIGTIAVSLILLILIALAVQKIIADRKAGKHSCGGNCGGCPMSGQCHQERRKPE
ncbi:MAG: FeoB-associated Cys-rich membrane protein [Lachnospiraceae bacterium]|nr:FeoB-associated Cys-rich membrane protein [Lachnospiraceae bacterium]